MKPYYAKEQIEQLLPFVYWMAWRLAKALPSHVEVDDLIQEGVLGLMQALAKFDPRQNVTVTSYVGYRVRGAMIDSLRAMDAVLGRSEELTGYEKPAEENESTKETAILADAIEQLPERGRRVLSLYYYGELRMKDIGARLGFSESRACQVHAQGIQRLRSRMVDGKIYRKRVA